MKIIRTTPNDSGAFPPMQEGDFPVLPDGYAVWPDTLDTAAFYAHNGFVRLSVSDHAVTACTPNVAAWEAWKASLPPEQDPEPTPEEDVDAIMVDHEYRLTLLELGVAEGV